MSEVTDKNSDINFQLWMYFSEDAAKVKDKLWTTASWLFTLLGGILGFIAKNMMENSLAFEKPNMILCVAIFGLAMSMYAAWLINEFGIHLKSAWRRTDYLQSFIPGLTKTWEAGKIRKDESETSYLPRFVKILLILPVFFALSFVGVFVLALSQIR